MFKSELEKCANALAMKRILFIASLTVLFTFDAWSQTDDLTSFNTDRLQVNKIGMIVLGSWALGNMGTNAALLRNPSSAEQGHFYRMNIFWNVVNLALAVPGLRHSLITDSASLSMAETLSEYHQMGKVLIFNAGLDIAYITGGFLLKEMAKTREKKRDIMTGYGRSLILQGGFLLAFDIVLFTVLQTKNSRLLNLLSNVNIDGNGIGLALKF